MKKRFLKIALFAFFISFISALIFCNIFGADHFYKFRFDKNQESDILKYRAIIFDSEDSTYTNPIDTLYFNHADFIDSVFFTYPMKENNRFVSFRVWAIDSLLQESIPGESNILKRINEIPSKPIKAEIRP